MCTAPHRFTPAVGAMTRAGDHLDPARSEPHGGAGRGSPGSVRDLRPDRRLSDIRTDGVVISRIADTAVAMMIVGGRRTRSGSQWKLRAAMRPCGVPDRARVSRVADRTLPPAHVADGDPARNRPRDHGVVVRVRRDAGLVEDDDRETRGMLAPFLVGAFNLAVVARGWMTNRTPWIVLGVALGTLQLIGTSGTSSQHAHAAITFGGDGRRW